MKGETVLGEVSEQKVRNSTSSARIARHCFKRSCDLIAHRISIEK